MRIFTILALILGFSVALVANGADKCTKMKGHGIITDYQEAPCLVDTDYDFCFVSEMHGNFNGSMVEYFMNEWLVLLDDLGIPTPPGALDGSYYNRELAVLSSKKGMIWGDAQYVFDMRTYGLGGVAVPMIVSGGTGIYEDADGWITWTFTDGDLVEFLYVGEVCGPYIKEE